MNEKAARKTKLLKWLMGVKFNKKRSKVDSWDNLILEE
jgi:hypothetical protein